MQSIAFAFQDPVNWSDYSVLFFGAAFIFVMYYVFLFIKDSELAHPLRTLQVGMIFFVFSSAASILVRVGVIESDTYAYALPAILQLVGMIAATWGLLHLKNALHVYKLQRNLIVKDILDIERKYKEGS